MAEYTKTCLECVRAESRHVPATGEIYTLCTDRDRSAVIEKRSKPCGNWYPRRLAALPPDYADGCGFPRCPVCNADLEVYCHLDGKLCGEVPFFDYCPACGQKIGREKGESGDA